MIIRNVIFDWSGTLVDDLEAVWRSTNYTLQKSGVPEMSLAEFRSEFSLPFDEFYSRVAPSVSLEQLEEWYKESFLEEQRSVRALPHAEEFFEYCRRQGKRTFLLSTIHPDHYRVQSQKMNFPFDREYVRVMDKRLKICEILRENNLSASETVFIGDMQHDVETAKTGGIFSCAVLTGYNTARQLAAVQPDWTVNDLSELQHQWETHGASLKTCYDE